MNFRNKFYILFLCFLVMGGFNQLTSQVTIGAGESPEKHALLQIKDKIFTTGDPSNGATAEKGGFLLPRVELEKKNELLPFANSADIGTPDYENTVKPAHTGLIVYNIKEVSEEDLSVGIHQWDGEKWVALQDKIGNAIGYITDCSLIGVNGEYQNTVSLNNGNNILLTLQITKPGAYNIIARAGYSGSPSTDNGYFFIASGMFLTAGKYTIQLSGSGTPLQYTPTGQSGDVITIAMNDKPLTLQNGTSCDVFIKVNDSSKKPIYVINCGTTQVKGVYKLNQNLSSTNYIETTLSVDPSAVGATYVLETNTVDGIYFKGTGILTGVSQTVQLQGYGKPTNLDKKVMTITSNSISEAVTTCNATVNIVIPKKRIYVLGHDLGYGYNLAAGSVARTIITHPNNFGVQENSIVKVDMPNFEFITPGNSVNATTLAAELTNNKPDILLITQDYYITEVNGIAPLVVDYLNKGGVVFFNWEANPYIGGGAQIFFQYLFGNPSIVQTRGNEGGGSIYKFNNTNDEILNGPFGDVRGKYWGEDASWCMSLTNLPIGELDIYSYGQDYSQKANNPIPSNPVIFKHKTLNLIYFGDGGFISAGAAALTNNLGYYPSTTICPFAFDPITFHPVAKNNYGYINSSFSVYNSIAFCNAFAWALKQAQFNGINTQ